jgi:hypothetical protein
MAAKLRDRFRIAVAQEIPGAIGRVLRDQARTLAGDQVTDLGELLELRARREPDIAVGKRVGPADAANDDQGQSARADAAPGNRESADGEHRRERNCRRGGGKGLALDPRRTDHGEHDTAGEHGPDVEHRADLAPPDAPGEAANRSGTRNHDQAVGQELIHRRQPKVSCRPDAGDLRGVQGADQISLRAVVGERR